ncbi:hypothetical protein [Halogeometricum limi]|uniref:Uncharacterized protein n=1 Tax=Halogeometricum limi TaxID=555875 RepID=A0A1I6GJQ5_9EURY|nr:hypothetical protein [Halogeometricum limi]SFR42408.1 hypothetical protein SAMN04488124_1147 [Halogeometricum limi]
MDEDEFEEIVSEGRVEKTWRRESGHGNEVERKHLHKPFVECPRCDEWKLAARTHQTREEKGLLVSMTEWKTVERWWQCDNCEGRFEIA